MQYQWPILLPYIGCSSTEVRMWMLILDLITRRYPKFNGGLGKPPSKLGHWWVLSPYRKQLIHDLFLVGPVSNGAWCCWKTNRLSMDYSKRNITKRLLLLYFWHTLILVLTPPLSFTSVQLYYCIAYFAGALISPGPLLLICFNFIPIMDK